VGAGLAGHVRLILLEEPYLTGVNTLLDAGKYADNLLAICGFDDLLAMLDTLAVVPLWSKNNCMNKFQPTRVS
jgi:hypothetical protein